MAYFPAQIFFEEYELHHEHYFQSWADTDEVRIQEQSMYALSNESGGSLTLSMHTPFAPGPLALSSGSHLLLRSLFVDR
jgi:hypothetical protein